MTEWETTYGSQIEQPEEFDTSSSSSFVYQRRKVEQVSVNNPNGTTSTLWKYQERKMSKNEYDVIELDRELKETEEELEETKEELKEAQKLSSL